MTALKSGAEPISKTFWYCVPFTNWPDTIDVLYFIFEICGILLNTFTLILLSRLRHGPRLSITLLQTLEVHCLLVCFVNLLEDVSPYGISVDNYAFNILFCVFWHSRFFYWIFVVAATQCLVFFSIDRLLVLRRWDQLRFTTYKRRIIYYEISIHVISLFLTLPQILTVNLQHEGCSCAPTQVNIPFLAFIYAHVYIWFSLLFVLDGTLLLVAAFFVAKWVRETHVRHQADELNAMSFNANESVKVVVTGWKTASMCILPLAVSYVVTFVYDATYQFLSALGFMAFVINSPQQKFGGLLLVIHANVVPMVLLGYLPPLREFVKRCVSAVIPHS